MLKKTFNESFFVFYTAHKKYRFCAKLDVHTYNVEMFTLNFCSQFFDIAKYVFRVTRAYAPMFQN